MEGYAKFKVSILVPIYGVEKHIERCAHSLFRQTYSNIEYIFVNDCTLDHSIEVLEKVIKLYPERASSVKIINHKTNKGLSSARNTALDNSTGDYLMHVDSDDYLDINAIELCINSAINTGADFVRLAILRIYSDHQTRDTIYFEDKDDYLRQILRRQTAMTVWGILYSRTLIERSGVRSVDGVSYAEDYCTLPRILFYANKVSYVSEANYNYIMTNSGSLMSVYSKKNYLDAKKSIQVLHDFFMTKGKEKYADDFQIGAMLFRWEMLRSCVSNNDVESWGILCSFPSYRISLVPSLKYRIILYLIKCNQFQLLRFLYRFF